MVRVFEYDGEPYIDKFDACELLGVAAHKDIGILLEGVFGNAQGARLSMVQQLETERVLGRLVRRGQHFIANTCDCTENPLWCSKSDRRAFLKEVVKSIADDGEVMEMDDDVDLNGLRLGTFSPAELLQRIRDQYPNSCLVNQHCFELSFTQGVISGDFVRVAGDRFRPWTKADIKIPKGGKPPAAQLRQWEASRLEALPKVNHYRQPGVMGD